MTKERAEEECTTMGEAYTEGYQQGRADEQIQSIEDAKMQATEYLDALDKAKKEAYQQGAKEFIEWLCQSKYREINNDTFSWYDNEGIDYMVSIDEVLAEWQKGEENEI